jgi:hypothetical protein
MKIEDLMNPVLERLGLRRRRRAYEKSMALRGKLRLEVDLDVSRERTLD